MGSALLVIALATSVYFAGPLPFAGVWEDSLMAARYGEELLRHKAMVWNPHGPATYGITGPYFLLLVVLPITALLRGCSLGVMLLASLIPGALFLAGICFLVLKAVSGPLSHRRAALALVAVSMAGAATHLSAHLVSGMDTCFSMLYLTAYLLVLKWCEGSHAVLPWMVTGAMGGLAFGVRPDLLAFTVLIPVACVLLSRDSAERRAAIIMLASTLVLLAGQMAWAHVYLHSALPLSFYVKALTVRPLYPGLTGDSANRWASLGQFAFFAISYWILFLAIVGDFCSDAGRWWRTVSPADKGLLVGLVVSIVYFAFLALPLMPGHQRFFYPALPAVVYLGSSAVVRMLQRLPALWNMLLSRMPSGFGYFVIAAAFFLPLPFLDGLHLHDLSSLAHRDFASFDLIQEFRSYWKTYWLGLDRFSSFPPDFVIATTEYGHVGTMNLDKEVIDMSGLNDILFARQPFSAALMFQNYRPDLIYMPHPDFGGMIQDLQTNPAFKSAYQYVPGAEGLGVALRRDSKYYPAMLSIVNGKPIGHG